MNSMDLRASIRSIIVLVLALWLAFVASAACHADNGGIFPQIGLGGAPSCIAISQDKKLLVSSLHPGE